MSGKEMVIKWIKAFFSKHFIKIVIGNFRHLFGITPDYYQQRYKICKKCSNLERTPIGEICGLCGCPLKSKLRVKDEKCLMNKF